MMKVMLGKPGQGHIQALCIAHKIARSCDSGGHDDDWLL